VGLLEGKVCFVTGAGHGQGRTHAVRMAEEGADLVVCDICAPVPQIPSPMATPAELDETAALVEEAGARVISGVADVRDLAAVKRIVQSGLKEFGRIDAVSANAGVWRPTPFIEIGEDEYDAIMDTNLRGVWNTCQAVVPSMIDHGGGSIVITSSAAGLRGQAPWAHYTASKHAVVGLMRSLANELARYAIRVNTVHPTGVNTFMGQQPAVAELAMNEPLFQMSAANMLDVATLEPEDVTNAVVWLLSDQAKWITGVTLPVDAGNTNKP
jgi:SDR family mycofactocin-dependent oxidoreductase